MSRCESEAWHHWQAAKGRLQCKYCGAYKGETIEESELRQSKEIQEEARHG